MRSFFCDRLLSENTVSTIGLGVEWRGKKKRKKKNLMCNRAWRTSGTRFALVCILVSCGVSDLSHVVKRAH